MPASPAFTRQGPLVRSLEDVGSGRRASRPASCATTASCPHGEAQTKRRKDRRERVEARITALRESSIERLSGKTGLACERSHAAHRFGYAGENWELYYLRDIEGRGVDFVSHETGECSG